MTSPAALARSRSHIFRAATIVMLFFIASRALGLLRDIVISHQFGTSRELDAYFAAFSIPDLVFSVIAGGALGSAFIPTFSSALAHGDTPRAWRLASAVLNLALIVLTIVAILLAVFAPQVVGATVARGFAPADLALTVNLMRWMLITPVVFGLSGIVMGILNSYQHFALPALAPVLYNAAIIAGALILAPTMGVYGLVAGVVGGAFLHLCCQLPWLIRQRMRYEPILGLRNPDVREVGRLMLPRTIGVAAVQVNFLVNLMLASTLAAGRIAALNYAWRVMLLPEGIIALSLATAVFPTLSEQNARSALDDFSRTFSTAMRTTLFLTIPAAAGLVMLGSPLIALLFQRGEFDAFSTAETAYALQFYALGLVAHSGLEILTRAFYAMHDTRTPVALSIVSVVLNIALSLVLIAPLAHGGLALANSIATVLEMLVLFVLFRRRMGVAEDGRIARSAAKSLAGTAALVGTLVPLTMALRGESPIVIATLGAAVGGVVYLGVTAGLRSEEIGMVLHRLRSFAYGRLPRTGN